MANIDKIIQVLSLAMTLSDTIKSSLGLIKEAQVQGRDITDDELAAIKQSAKGSMDSLKEALEESEGKAGG